MIVYSDQQLETFQVLGNIVRIHWGHEEYEVEGRKAWKCEEIVLPTNVSKEEFEVLVATAGGPVLELVAEWFK